MELLETCKKKFERLLEKIQTEQNLPKKVVFAKTAIDLAVNGSTCYYSSEIIENVFLKLAETIEISLSDAYDSNSCLHVMTLCSESGGHTRVVERWIELSEAHHKQSLIFTLMENQSVPKRLQNAVRDKCGTIHFLADNLSDTEKGAKLREIAAQYEVIILHVHMYDVIPLIAFGTSEFKRPVVFFNHADHRFWVGVSIADVIAELRSFGNELSQKYRGSSHNFILSIPVDYKVKKNISKNDAREKLGIDQNIKVILTIGEALKYIPVPGCDFLDSVYGILNQDDSALMLAVGPEYSTLPKWKSIKLQFNKRLRVIGQVPKGELLPYIAAADVILDSRPMSGGLALIDALSYGRPVLSVDNPVGQVDWVKQSIAYCSTVEQANEKALQIAQNFELQQQYVQEEQASLERYDSLEAWCRRLGTMMKSLPQKHLIYPFQTHASDFRPLDYYHFYQSFRLCLEIGRYIKLYKIKSKGWKKILFVFGHKTVSLSYRKY